MTIAGRALIVAQARDLAREVGELELLKQHPSNELQGSAVGAEQLVQPFVELPRWSASTS